MSAIQASAGTMSQLRGSVGGDLYQIGVVVRTLEVGMARYTDLFGLGPFMQMQTRYRARYRDWEGEIANRNAFAKWGSLYLEMVEPGEGHGNAREWLEQRGEGIFHLGFGVDDMSQRPGGLEPCFDVLSAYGEDGQPQVLHFDTVDTLGYFTEISPRLMVARLTDAIDAAVGAQAELPQ